MARQVHHVRHVRVHNGDWIATLPTLPPALEKLSRHARLYGTEGVFEVAGAIGIFTASDLAKLSRELRESGKPSGRRGGKWTLSKSDTRKLALDLASEGKVAAEIATDLGVTEKTIRAYVEKPEVAA